MIGQAIWAKNVDRNAKKWKRPPKSLKNKMFIFGLHSTSDDRPSNPSKKCWPNHKKNEKGPLSHQKIKCSFLDYVQLLMIGQAIQAKNVDQTIKKWKRPPKSSKNQMFIFGLHSTSDDWPSNPRVKKKNKKGPLSQPKTSDDWPSNKKTSKRPPKSSKNQMFIFGLHGLSNLFNFWWSAKKKKCQPKCKKTKGPLSHWKIKCSFLDYIQLLMIGWAIWVKNVNQNAKKQKRPPKSSKNQMFISGLCSTSDDQPSNLSKKHWPKHKKMKKAP